MKILLDAKQIKKILSDLSEQIISDTPENMEIAIVGIRSRGEMLAERLAENLSKIRGKEIPCGTLDITLYRDDLNSPGSKPHPHVQPTEIPFDVEGKIIILVDDVLYTGRSTRAAMGALIDLGRPKAIRLAVLVERLIGREFPIQADYTGYKSNALPEQRIQVHLLESDGKDEVFIE